jgi:hypothetical protein
MSIVAALKQEESKLQRQLTAVRGAIVALNGAEKFVAPAGRSGNTNGTRPKRTMSAAVKARIARAAKARWAKIKADKAKKTK